MQLFETQPERFLEIIPDNDSPRTSGQAHQRAVREVVGEVTYRNPHMVIVKPASHEIVSISGVRTLPTNAPIAVIIETAINLPL